MITEKQVRRLKEIVDMPLSTKIKVINKYIDTMGMDLRLIREENIHDHQGQIATINEVYSRICKPHKLIICKKKP